MQERRSMGDNDVNLCFAFIGTVRSSSLVSLLSDESNADI